MKKIIFLFLVTIVTVFQFCSSSGKAAATAQKVTYTRTMKPLIRANCTPCHIPPQGRAKHFHTYDAAKAHAGEMIRRINLSPEEKGFMPAKHPKLSDSVISVFVKWKSDGLVEK